MYAQKSKCKSLFKNECVLRRKREETRTFPARRGHGVIGSCHSSCQHHRQDSWLMSRNWFPREIIASSWSCNHRWQHRTWPKSNQSVICWWKTHKGSIRSASLIDHCPTCIFSSGQMDISYICEKTKHSCLRFSLVRLNRQNKASVFAIYQIGQDRWEQHFHV